MDCIKKTTKYDHSGWYQIHDAQRKMHAHHFYFAFVLFITFSCTNQMNHDVVWSPKHLGPRSASADCTG